MPGTSFFLERKHMTEITVSGRIERIIFENPSNFYKILLLEIEETTGDIDDYDLIVTGTMADVFEGEDYTFYGQLVTHAKYGLQLQMTRYERAKPSQAGLIKYFSSDQFKGIGRKTAEKIVELYGEDTIDAILAAPEKLTSITGLSASNRQAFLDKLRLNYGTEMILAKLASYGIPNKLAFQIQDIYKEKTLAILEENPYQLVEDIEGMGFSIADSIAQQLGIEATAPERYRAGLLYCLLQGCLERGDTFLEARTLLEETVAILEKARPVELDPAFIAQELTQLLAEDKVQQIETKIFPNSLFFAEAGIHKHLNRLLKKQGNRQFAEPAILEAISKVEKESGLIYDKLQKQAIVSAIQSPIFVLTGGPGTGKTTIINGIIAVYALLHQIDLTRLQGETPVLLAAPTGRAARRMNELTGLPSATIHRHLGLTGETTESYRDDYLDADFIIVDEFSMVDTWLAHQLFQHISSKTQLLIVGDAEQLPSVGPGQVLADLLALPNLPSLTLETIYRQSEDSTIVTLASHIRKGQLPADFRDKKPDRSYFDIRSEDIPASMERIVRAAIQSGIPAQDIQILAPMYKGQVGIDTLNRITQDLLNPSSSSGIEFAYQDSFFRQGDRVIQLVNEAENNIFNGDVGYITDLLPAKYSDSKQDELTIQFEGNEISYPRNEWYKITLAYAMSIHKSQGSEFPVVILPITKASHRMLQRNLLYTAITRSKSKLVMLGDYTAFDYAVKHQGTSRQTYLKERFGLAESKEMAIETDTKTEGPHLLTPDNYLRIDPMIGLSQPDIEAFFKTS